MSVCMTIFKASVLALMTSGLSFAAIADSASKFLGNIITLDEIPEDFGTYLKCALQWFAFLLLRIPDILDGIHFAALVF